MNKISKVSFLICLVEFFTPFLHFAWVLHVLGSYYFGGEKDTLLFEFSLAVFSSRSGGTYKSRNKKSLYAFAVKVFM